jgi:hypothetical protein
MAIKRAFHLFSLTLFVFGAAFLVLHVEFNEGQFLYYFFKSKVYYSQHNKIILPAGFWVCFVIFYVFYDLTSKKKENCCELFIHSLRYAFFYHLFLLLLTHSNEIVSGLSYGSLAHSGYERLFIPVAFICYYLASINIVRKAMVSGCQLWELTLPISAIIPYLFLPSPLIHISYLIISLGLYGCWKLISNERLRTLLEQLKFNDFVKIGAILSLSLFFRLWYASHYAAFDLVGYSADGPVYFKSALAFSKGNLTDVNFWHAPFYSLYLSIFLYIFGETSAVIFYSQAFIGALTPVLIFLIARELKLKQASFISGLLVAVSHLCIHYSVVINRATPLTLTIPLIVYLLLRWRINFSPIKCLLLGLLFGATFYWGQETAAILSLSGIYLVRHIWKMRGGFKQNIYHSSYVVIGAMVVFFGLNAIYYAHTEEWIPLGRAADPIHASSLWNYNNNSYAKEMIALGFDPIKSPAKSSHVFFENPLIIVQLLLGKLFLEIPDFLFDPGGIRFMPLHLVFESFYAANVQFYTYLFIAIGVFVFFANKLIEGRDKKLILGAILIHIIFCSFLLGTFRFRVPITPFNMILMASALEWLLFREKKLEDRFLQAVKFEIPILIKSEVQQRTKYLVANGVIVILSFLWIYKVSFPSLPQTYSQYRLTQWLTIPKEKVLATKTIGINRTVFTYYRGKGEHPDIEIRFNMCRKLMPGIKPYFQLAVDGKLIGRPQEILSGCSIINEAINFDFDTGMISLFVFVSEDGKIGELQPVSISVNGSSNKKETVTMPIAIPGPLDIELKKYVEQFQIYAGNVKIGAPTLFLLPKVESQKKLVSAKEKETF